MTLAGINLVTTNGMTVMTNGTWILYSNSLNANDQISYAISDGQGGTNTGYINIVVNYSVTGTNSIAGIVNHGASMTVSAFGIPGYSYILERATNLIPAVWVDITTNTAATNGVINATDSLMILATCRPARRFTG